MSSPLEAAYVSLCRSGQLATESMPHRLGNLTFRHPNEGVHPVMIDRETLRQCSNIYARPSVRNALREFSMQTKLYPAAIRLIEAFFGQQQLIWGVSGFASVEYNYTEEGRGLSELYSYLGGEQQPSLVVDGGVAQGVLGLNGVLAALRGIPSFGCIPLQGLASLGQREHLLVWGNTYRDREILVGSLPDILVCVGGGPGTIRECLHALEHGSVVLILGLKAYGPGTLPQSYFANEKMREAITQGRLLVCDSLSTLPEKAQQAWEAGQLYARLSRTKRLPIVRKLLAA